MAAAFDLRKGESLTNRDADLAPSAEAVEHLVYAQPSLKATADERGPQPYRRAHDAASHSQESDTVVDEATSTDMRSGEQSFHTALWNVAATNQTDRATQTNLECDATGHDV